MKLFTFWRRWLLVASIGFALNGLAVCWWPDSPHLDVWNAAIRETFGSEGEDVRRFLLGPLGGTMAGYFAMQTFIVWIPFRRRERWAWTAVISALLTWFVSDTLASLRAGAVFNIWMVNVPALIAAGIPLLATRPAFRRE
ncbi:MAG: hypothetical protein IPM24_19710, partial [Bryobacterales bacterium]|jgi:hypothetical protein|nr:hypothetical protein [Bryobacterales bacterium]